MRPRFLCLLLSFGLACDPGEITLVDRARGAGIERSVVTVTAKVDLADSALADSLGWQAGVPQAEVFLLRNGSFDWQRFETDARGTLQIEDLLSGLYRVYAGRALTDDELQLVGGAARSFGDGRTVGIGGNSALQLDLFADRPGTLVFSEFGNGIPPSFETNGSYGGGLYFEVYNNSDSVYYLDGVIVGRAFARGFADSDASPCSVSEPIRTDGAGLYAHWMLSFPGSGTEYPLLPGEAKTVAVAAIDHTPAHSTLLDLSGADFEIGGGGAADNPAVPNMLDIGLDPWFPLFLLMIRDVYFLARPTDLGMLTVRYTHPTDGRVYPRVPADSLLDVVALAKLFNSDAETPPCAQMVSRRFNRYEGGFQLASVDQPLESIQRHLLRTARDGRVILRNARTSAVDFFVGSRTPGELPAPFEFRMLNHR